jgi:hypothetical protein
MTASVTVAKDAEYYISRAEIAYKSGKMVAAIRAATRAISLTESDSRRIALRIFIARAHGKLGRLTESNVIYRALLREGVYMPSVVMGLFYNSFQVASAEKMRLNFRLVKVLTVGQE